MARAAGGTYEDTEGLINLPLTVKEIQAVVFFKQVEGDEYRVSMRSKGDIDIGAVAKEFGGGGHKNAAGCTVDRRRIDAAAEDCSSRRSTTQSRRVAMDGLLVIDKPAGPTSHDVVARVRRALGERRIGHTGTLDPAATGVLPLVLGRATRLARFLSAERQVVRRRRPSRRRDRHLRRARDAGRRAAIDGPLPSREAIDGALDAFRGTFLQQPPAFSAKKIDGTRSYALARAARARRERGTRPAGLAAPAPPLPAPVERHRPRDRHRDASRATASRCASTAPPASTCGRSRTTSGERLGTGAHLAALRRTRSGDVDARPRRSRSTRSNATRPAAAAP